MEKKLSQLFDFQHFSGSKRLAAVIGDVESRYSQELSDDDLLTVNAAGTDSIPTVMPVPLLARHDIPEEEGRKA